jgi:hypothetical protein
LTKGSNQYVTIYAVRESRNECGNEIPVTKKYKGKQGEVQTRGGANNGKIMLI